MLQAINGEEGHTNLDDEEEATKWSSKWPRTGEDEDARRREDGNGGEEKRRRGSWTSGGCAF